MPTNSIGQGAVVLTANADSLLAGLDKAERATVKFAKSAPAKANAAGKSTGGGEGGGGIFGALLFGGAAGAAAGVALKGIDLVTGAVGNLVNRLASVGEKVKEYGNIDVGRRLRIDRAVKGFDRITAAVDDFYFRAAEKLAPVIERVAGALEVVSHVGAAGFDQLVDSTGRALSLIGNLVGVTDEFGNAGEGATDRMFKGLRNVALALAKIENMLGKIGNFGLDNVLPGALSQFGTITQLLDKAFGTDASKFLANQYEIRAGKLRETFDAAAKDSIDDINKFFDREQKKFDATARIKRFSGPLLSGAALANSNEAQGIISRYQAANIITGLSPADNPVKIQKEQLKEAREAKRLLTKIADGIGGGVIKVIP